MPDAVEAALEETLVSMKAGAHPLTIPPVMADEMKARYRPDYEANAQYWPNDKLKILVLARIVGSLAEFLTRAKAQMNGAQPGDTVDGRCLYWAGYVMSRVICPPPGAKGMLGRHCENYPGARSLPVAVIAWLLRMLIRFTGFRVTAGPLIAQ